MKNKRGMSLSSEKLCEELHKQGYKILVLPETSKDYFKMEREK